MNHYPLDPRPVPRVETAFRRIVTDLPVPESIPVLESLAAHEPLAMQGQPPVVWDRATGFQVHDRWGNTWLDWSSGVLVANAGHGRPEIIDAIVKQAQHGLLTNYAFPSEIRAQLAQRLSELMPEPMKKIFLLTTGSEAVECAIKLCRAHGRRRDPRKNVIVSYDKAFHGRTLGSQQAGGIPVLKDWIGNLDPGFVQIEFPDGFRTPDTSFAYFERQLAERGVEPHQVAGVILETYQGGSAAFAPVEYMRALRDWCTRHGSLLVCDEVQAGFGRTGELWGFLHYGITPDVTTWGKGVSSSMPLSFTAASAELFDIFPPGSMSSTHTGNPICCAAALANIEIILNENLTANARRMGDLLHQRLRDLQAKFPDHIASIAGKGLVAGVHCVQPGGISPNGPLAAEIVKRCWQKGLLMFNPVGFGGGTVKISPPLVITEAAILESTAVLEEAFVEALVAAPVAT